jgi:hypothetical protein
MVSLPLLALLLLLLPQAKGCPNPYNMTAQCKADGLFKGLDHDSKVLLPVWTTEEPENMDLKEDLKEDSKKGPKDAPKDAKDPKHAAKEDAHEGRRRLMAAKKEEGKKKELKCKGIHQVGNAPACERFCCIGGGYACGEEPLVQVRALEMRVSEDRGLFAANGE